MDIMKKIRKAKSMMSFGLALALAAGLNFGMNKVAAKADKPAPKQQPVVVQNAPIDDTTVGALGDLGLSVQELDKLLKDQHKTITEKQRQEFVKRANIHRAAQQKPYEEAVVNARIINEGKVAATTAEKSAARAFLQVQAGFSSKKFAEFTSAEANKAGSEALKFNSQLSAKLKKALQEYKKKAGTEPTATKTTGSQNSGQKTTNTGKVGKTGETAATAGSEILGIVSLLGAAVIKHKKEKF